MFSAFRASSPATEVPPPDTNTSEVTKEYYGVFQLAEDKVVHLLLEKNAEDGPPTVADWKKELGRDTLLNIAEEHCEKWVLVVDWVRILFYGFCSLSQSRGVG